MNRLIVSLRKVESGKKMIEKKLTIQDQVEFLKQKGVIVENLTYAVDYLSKHLNFYRLFAYTKLLSFKSTNKIINGVTFNHLVELSKIDLAFRRVILPMTIDIEFAAKLEMNCDCSCNTADDGYSFASSYVQNNPELSKKYIDKIQKNTDEYGKDILKDHYPDLAVWHLTELMTFGDFINFWKQYYNQFPKPGLNITWRNNLFFVTKKLRNACAHNNFMLPSLVKKPSQVNKQLTSKLPIELVRHGVQLSESEKKTVRNSMLISDFAMMLMLFDEIVISNSLRTKAKSELNNLLTKRMIENKELFSITPELSTYYHVFKKILAVFCV